MKIDIRKGVFVVFYYFCFKKGICENSDVKWETTYRVNNLTAVVHWHKNECYIVKRQDNRKYDYHVDLFYVLSRCSPAFLAEERAVLEERREKIRQLQQRKATEFNSIKDLPDEIPLHLVIGTKVTGWCFYLRTCNLFKICFTYIS